MATGRGALVIGASDAGSVIASLGNRDARVLLPYLPAGCVNIGLVGRCWPPGPGEHFYQDARHIEAALL